MREPSRDDRRLYERLIAVFRLPPMPVIDATALLTRQGGGQSGDYRLAPLFPRWMIEAHSIIDGIVVQRGIVVFDRSGKPPIPGEAIPPGTFWRLAAYPFLWSSIMPQRISNFLGGIALLHASLDGAWLDDPGNVQICFERFPTVLSPEMKRDAARGVASMLPLALRATTALHHGALVEYLKPLNEHQRDAAVRRGWPGPALYRVMMPMPAPSVPDGETPPARSGMIGRFRYYAPDAPLLGSYAGAVWEPEYRDTQRVVWGGWLRYQGSRNS